MSDAGGKFDGPNGLFSLSAADAPGQAIRLSGASLTDKQAMLVALAAALDFPDWFGHNWDALEECLTDLSWWDDEVVLLIDEVAIPETQAPEDWAILLDILDSAAAFWDEEGRRFAVYLVAGRLPDPAPPD
jgi:hypothetical protein